MNPPFGADEDLARAFLEDRSEDAFRALYRRHTPALYLLACRVLGGRIGSAEDAVQDAWMRAAGALSAFRWESSLRTWLSGIVIRRCLELVRRGARRPEVDIESVREREAPDGRADSDRLDLERQIRSLPDGYREVLVLHDLAGYTHEEIASITGIAAGSSKSQLCRARRALRSRLGTRERSGDGRHS